MTCWLTYAVLESQFIFFLLVNHFVFFCRTSLHSRRYRFFLIQVLFEFVLFSMSRRICRVKKTTSHSQQSWKMQRKTDRHCIQNAIRFGYRLMWCVRPHIRPYEYFAFADDEKKETTTCINYLVHWLSCSYY